MGGNYLHCAAQRQTHTEADIHLQIYTRARITYTLHDASNNGEMLILAQTEIPTHAYGTLHATSRQRGSLINSTQAHCWRLKMVFSLNSTLSTQDLTSTCFLSSR